jgi:hypothetical protein
MIHAAKLFRQISILGASFAFCQFVFDSRFVDFIQLLVS